MVTTFEVNVIYRFCLLARLFMPGFFSRLLIFSLFFFVCMSEVVALRRISPFFG